MVHAPKASPNSPFDDEESLMKSYLPPGQYVLQGRGPVQWSAKFWKIQSQSANCKETLKNLEKFRVNSDVRRKFSCKYRRQSAKFCFTLPSASAPGAGPDVLACLLHY